MTLISTWAEHQHSLRKHTRSVGSILSQLPPPCRGFLPFHASGHWLAWFWMASSSARWKCPLLSRSQLITRVYHEQSNAINHEHLDRAATSPTQLLSSDSGPGRARHTVVSRSVLQELVPLRRVLYPVVLDGVMILEKRH